jgi:hypothetical protein
MQKYERYSSESGLKKRIHELKIDGNKTYRVTKLKQTKFAKDRRGHLGEFLKYTITIKEKKK